MKKNVKRNLKLFCATAALCGAMSFSAFAAENQDEFKAEAAPIFEQMQELNAQINPLRQENNEISARYKEICASLKAGGAGIRYTCRIAGRVKYIWLEETRWFVEAKE